MQITVTNFSTAFNWINQLDWYMEKADIDGHPNPAHLVAAAVTKGELIEGAPPLMPADAINWDSFKRAADFFKHVGHVYGGGIADPRTMEDLLQWICKEARCTLLFHPDGLLNIMPEARYGIKPEQMITKTQQLEELNNAKDQFAEAADTGMVHCGCGKHLEAYRMFRCLYCGVYHCNTCAEDHFGKTREQWKAEQVVIDD